MNKQYRMNPIAGPGVAVAVLALPAVVTLVSPSAAGAQDATDVRPLVIEAQNLMASDARHRALAEAGRDPQTLLAGDIIRYRLTFTNTMDVPVGTVEFVDPIPEGLRYVPETAVADREDVLVEFSIDDGASYTARPVVVEVVDGETVEKPAPPERYTHIRWTVTGWVQPGAQVTAQFDVTLDGSTDDDRNDDTNINTSNTSTKATSRTNTTDSRPGGGSSSPTPEERQT